VRKKHELLSSVTLGGGGSTEQPMMLRAPLIVMFREPSDGMIVCHIHPPSGWGASEYGLILCDLVRHVSRALKVKEDDVWEWLDKERHHPTTTLSWPS